MKSKSNRRVFLKGAGAGAVALSMPTYLRPAKAQENQLSPHSPDERRFRPIATHDSMGKSIA